MSRFEDNVSDGFLAALARLEPASDADAVTLGEMFDRLDERAYGLLLLLLALPCLAPGLPGAQLFAAIMLILGLQLLAGRSEPWLPRAILNRSIPTRSISGLIRFARRRLAWIERVSRPRARMFSTGAGERFVALAVIIAALAVMLPVTNTAPSIAITLLAIGLIQRDGVLCLLGSVIAGLWVGVLALVGWGLLNGAQWVSRLLPS